MDIKINQTSITAYMKFGSTRKNINTMMFSQYNKQRSLNIICNYPVWISYIVYHTGWEFNSVIMIKTQVGYLSLQRSEQYKSHHGNPLSSSFHSHNHSF